MTKEFIGTGKTIEEATSAAKIGLNAPSTADIKIEVVAMPAKKFLGIFGGSDAKVKASYDDGKKARKPKPKKDIAPKERPKKEAVKKQAPKKDVPKKDAPKKDMQKKAPAKKQGPREDNNKQSRPRETVSESEIDLNYASAYLKAMIDGLGVENAKISAKFVDGMVEMEVDCEDYGIIIGRRGDTLDSLQYLTSLAIKKQTDKYVRVTVNVGNYREKRVETLTNLARKNAAYVARTGKRYTFEPMNPYERRVIHTAIADFNGVESKSIGYDQGRRIVLEPTGGVKSGGAPNQRRGGSKTTTSAKPNPAPKADRADLPKFGKIEINKD